MLCPQKIASCQLHSKFFPAGIPTLLYGLAGLALARHTETVKTSKGPVTIYFWYREPRSARFRNVHRKIVLSVDIAYFFRF